MRLDIRDFPVDFDGNVIAKSWVISIPHIVNWMMRVVEKKHFTPRNDPRTMTPLMAQQGIAETLCPRSNWDTLGIAVNFEQTRGMTTASHCVLYFAEPVSWPMVQNSTYGANIGPSLTSVYNLNRFLERGGKLKTVIGPTWRQGLPIGDNVALVKMELARRALEKRRKEEEEAKRNLTLAEKMAGAQGNYTTEILYRRQGGCQGEKQPSIPT